MLHYTKKTEELSGLGNWATAKDIFPKIEVDQKKQLVTITECSVSDNKAGQWGKTHELHITKSGKDDIIRITGMCGLRNDKRHTGGRQKFCFFVFRGDSGHFYTHRCVASKGWMNCNPKDFLKRLVKTGIGAVTGVYQQGDFLLKPANGNAIPDSDFIHETKGSGHHNFEMPVLFARSCHGRQYLITEPTMLIHTAVDGIQHPDILVQPGKYIVGTTNIGLDHDNRRD